MCWRCLRRCSKRSSNSAHLRPGEAWERRCTYLIHFIGRCMQAMYAGAVQSVVRTALCTAPLYFPERTEIWRCWVAVQKRPTNNAQMNNTFIFLDRRCTSRPTYSDSYSAQGNFCATFQNNVPSSWHPIYMPLCLRSALRVQKFIFFT